MTIMGNWAVKLTTPLGPQAFIFAFETVGDEVRGTAQNSMETVHIKDLAILGDSAAGTIPVTQPIQIDLNFDVSASGDALSGTAKGGFLGEMNVTGNRGQTQSSDV